MSGSAEVNRNLGKWFLAVRVELPRAMDTHIKGSQAFAVADHRWTDRTGSATANLKSKTESTPGEITSTIYGDIKLNEWLDQSWFFQGRYKLIERARSHNIAGLWMKIGLIMSRAGGRLF